MKNATGNSLETIKALVNQCDRCGACVSVCPLYDLNNRESSVARGKIALARALVEGGLATNTEIAKTFEFCLLCKACTHNCPSKVKTDEVMIEARQYAAEKLGRRVKHKLISGFLGSNVLIGLVSLILHVSRKTGLSKLLRAIVPQEHTRGHFQEMAAGPAVFPPLSSAQRPGQELLRTRKIAYYQGCAMKLFFPDAAQASINLLSKTAEVVIPSSVCCGTPHLAHGLAEQAKVLAQKNIELFAEADVIVTDCASCGSSLKEYGHRLAEDLEWSGKAKQFSEKVMGLSEYFSKVGYQPEQKITTKITYHDPCHLVRGQGIKKQPRELLQLAAEYVELPQADKCCGGAGTFYLDFPNEAQQILAEKVGNIAKTGAEIVVTECPACMMQLAKGGQQSSKFKVMHISQVL